MSSAQVITDPDQTGFEEERQEIFVANNMAALIRAEVDVQVTTAKAYPRNAKANLAQAKAYALLDEDTAAECFYRIPRKGGMVEGPSIRFAEIICATWGNFRAEARLVDVGERTVTAEAVAWDLETNAAIKEAVTTRITTKEGKRYGDDMIEKTSNAARSKALRNAVFRIVPRALWLPIYEAARKLAAGEAKSLRQNRADAIKALSSLGITPEMICHRLGRNNVEEITHDDIVDLRSAYKSIRSGELSVEEAFPMDFTGGEGGNGNGKPKTKQDLKDAIDRKRKEVEATSGNGHGKPTPEAQPEETPDKPAATDVPAESEVPPGVDPETGEVLDEEADATRTGDSEAKPQPTGMFGDDGQEFPPLKPVEKPDEYYLMGERKRMPNNGIDRADLVRAEDAILANEQTRKQWCDSFNIPALCDLSPEQWNELMETLGER